MGQDPSQIRQEIEATRSEMGETVDALAYKTDVKTRVKSSVAEQRDRAQRAVGAAEENPIGLALAGVAGGFLVGMMLPSSRIEDERVGPLADQVKETAAETGQEALDRGKQIASQAAEQTVEAAQEVGEKVRS